MNLATGSRETFKLGDGPSAETYGISGGPWIPAITRRPTFQLELFSPSLNPEIGVGRSNFDISARALNVQGRNDLKWHGAPVKIYLCPALVKGAAWFDGCVSTPTPDIQGENLSLACEVRRDKFTRPALTTAWAGTGGAGGDAEMRGVYKPLGYGVCLNVPVVWFDQTTWIGCIDGYGNLSSVQKLMEGGNGWGAAQGNYANYAALKAAIDATTVKPGMWATCIAEGLIGLGAPPVKPITVDATFQHGTLGGIVTALLSEQLGLTTADYDDASLTALDAACPYTAHFWTNEQRSIDDIIGSLASSATASALVGFNGKLTVTRATRSSPVATVIDLSGARIPRVTDRKAMSALPPFWWIKAKAEQPEQVLSLTDIIFDYDFVPSGLYDNTKSYPPGSLVYNASGGEFLVKGDQPVSGHALPTGTYPAENTWWIQTKPNLTAEGIEYDSGQTIADVLDRPPAQSLLRDATFDSKFWTLATNGSRVSYATATSGYALQVSFQASTAAYSIYSGTKSVYAQIRKDKLVYVSASVDSTPGTDATWDLIVSVDWLTAGGSAISTTVVKTISPSAGGEQNFVEAITPPSTARRARLKFGHASTTGKTGQWTVYDPFLSHQEPGSSQAAGITGEATTFIDCTAAGVPKAGQVNPRYIQFSLIRLGVDVTNSATWTRTLQSGSATSTMGDTVSTNKGQLNITGPTDDSFTESKILVQATYQGLTYSAVHTLRKTVDPNVSGSGGGGSASGAMNGTITSASLVALSDEIEVLVGSGGNVALSANYTYYIFSGTSEYLWCRWYEWNGSSYVAIGSEVQASTAASISSSGGWPVYNAGAGTCNYTRTGLTAATTKKFRLYARGDDATFTRSVSGTVSGAGS